MRVWSTIVNALESHGACALVTQIEVEGSAPREAGARMVVMPDGTFTGTVGGGALEWRVLARAQKMLQVGGALEVTRHALGPELGQCCGGAVQIMIEVWTAGRLGEAEALAAAEAEGPFVCKSSVHPGKVSRTVCAAAGGELYDPLRAQDLPPSGLTRGSMVPRDGHSDSLKDGPSGQARGRQFFPGGGRMTERFGEHRRGVFLFGAGHVGRALMLALAPLPFAVTWIDQRRSAFPAAVPANVTIVASADPARELAAADDDAFVLAMTHSHAFDFDIVHTALAAGRFGYVGVIGSRTKRARFISRLRKMDIGEECLASLVCPIGMPGVSSKTPAAIAAVVAAELLQRDELVKTGQKPVQDREKTVKLLSAG